MTKITVLIVDDDESICMLLKAFLESEGLKAITCHDGQSAVDLLETMPIDIILLDVMMPEMDGFETLRRIRARHSVPVIFLTARDMLTDKEKGFEAGADDYIVKPLTPAKSSCASARNSGKPVKSRRAP
jgi:DNA-binding response OmpR family regulator